MKRIMILLLAVAAALILGGCGMVTVEDLYAVPQRSEEYQNLRTVIQNAMFGVEYCAPVTGENQQTVQLADLEGDGVPEYLLFAKSVSDGSLQVLIFSQTEDTFVHKETINLSGSAFDQVEYVQMDDQAGLELVVGRKLGEQILHNVAVFSFGSGRAELLVSASYTKFLTVDLDADRRSELFVLRQGEEEKTSGIAELFGVENGIMERSVEASMSAPAEQLKRIMVGKLHEGIPAVYTACTVGDSAMITDVYAMIDGKFTNVTFSNDSGTSVQTLRNYYVYAEDIDEDGVVELPDLVNMHMAEDMSSLPDQYVIRWYAMTATGAEVNKMFTYHNFVGGWYLHLGSEWANRTLIRQEESGLAFYVWDEKFTKIEKIATVYTLTGNDREEQAAQENRFVLHRTDTVVYCASLEVASTDYGITRESMINAFRLIHQDWKTGET